MARKSAKRFSEKAMPQAKTRMIPKKSALHLMRGGHRFSDQIMRQTKKA
jgi:hypothetical protein